MFEHLCILSLIFIVLFISCEIEKSPIEKYETIPSPLLGRYHIEAFDTLNVILCEGELNIDHHEATKITGTWFLENVNLQSPIWLYVNQ